MISIGFGKLLKTSTVKLLSECVGARLWKYLSKERSFIIIYWTIQEIVHPPHFTDTCPQHHRIVLGGPDITVNLKFFKFTLLIRTFFFHFWLFYPFFFYFNCLLIFSKITFICTQIKTKVSGYNSISAN